MKQKLIKDAAYWLAWSNVSSYLQWTEPSPMSTGNQENVPTLAISQSDGGKSLLKVPSSHVCQIDSRGGSKNSKDVSQVTEELTTCPCLLVYSS